MKKLLLIPVFLFCISIAKSQELGIRVGDVLGNNVAIDGVFSLGEFSRVHADVSFGNGGLGVEALWDFLYRPFPNANGLYWYVGAGPWMYIDDPFYLGAVGEIGLEYRFAEVPIALGIDWRPAISIIEDFDFIADGFGFNARYVFGAVK